MDIETVNKIAKSYLRKQRKLAMLTTVRITHSGISPDGEIWIVKVAYNLGKKEYKATLNISDTDGEVLKFSAS